MKQITYLLSLFVASVLSYSCSNEEQMAGTETDGATTVNFTLSGNGIITRSLTSEESTGYKTVIKSSDEIGIYGTGTTSATSNVRATVNADGNGLTVTTPITIGANSTASFMAYTPYVASASETLTFNVKSDQSIADNFNASNLLTASADGVMATSPNVSFIFEPRMALVRVEMAGAEGINTTSVKVNAKPQVSWNTTSNEISEATGTATDITMWNQNSGDVNANSRIFAAFVPGQSIVGGSQFLTMHVGEKQYCFKPKTNFALIAGKINKFKITIGENGEITIESITINVKDWEVNDLTTIEGDIVEIEPEPEQPIELISPTTITAETPLTEVTGLRGTTEGWNAILVKGTDATLATVASSITFDATESAFKITDDGTGKGWYQKALVYRTGDAQNSFGGKYELKFEVKTNNGKEARVCVMKGQNSTFTTDTYYCIGTNSYQAQYYVTTTTNADGNKVAGQWITKKYTVDLNSLGTNTSNTATTKEDLANGIMIGFGLKTASDSDELYIRNLSLIEITE